ncbi:hypothetical protein [Sphingomonas aerophila]|uniref:Uncharacterized protein n=1 Tax=Sphingomonas aerophila TaxID=1344948 RepID=A0A7W9BGP0_9SPHN|nr:hypothetical protein [Sphingomonas aerophila]MBB5716808.1 hypothetical protein [Sphingomonas aerophila]
MFAELQAAGLTLPPQPSPAPIVPPADPQPWPFAEWHVAVLRRRELTADPARMLERLAPGRLEALRPGEVPPGTLHNCWVTLGLLFTGGTGERLLVAPDAMPFSLLVTREGAAIDAFARWCRSLDLNAYLGQR